MRTEQEKLIDILVLLRVIERAAKRIDFDGLMMAQKLLFSISVIFRSKNMHGTNQTFYRWNYGPMSDDLYADFSNADNLSLITNTKRPTLSEHGRDVLETAESLFDNNPEFTEVIDYVSNRVEDLDSLLEEVYAMEVYVEELDERIPVKDIPEGYNILSPVWADEADNTLTIQPGLEDTIEMIIDKDVKKELNEALDDLRSGRVFPLELD